MAEEITAENVAAAEAQLVDIKADPDTSAEEYKNAAQALTDLRQAFRLQEEAAGRRTGLVGVEAGEE